MRLNLTLAFAMIATMLCSCGNRPSGTVQEARQLPELMQTVPSDALAVLDFSRVDKGMRMQLDSTSAISRLNLRDFRSSRMMLSYVYMGKLVPLLAIEAGRAGADTSSAVRSLLGQADTCGVFSRFLAGGVEGGRHSIVLLSTSEVLIPSVERHLESGASIIDAPRFSEALAVTGGRTDHIYFRNAGLDRTLPRDYLSRYLPRRQMSLFLQKAADWMVVNAADGPEKLLVTPVFSDTYSQYTRFLEDVGTGESRLLPVLPTDTEFVIDLVVGKDFRGSYEDYLDACVRLDAYRAGLAELKNQSGKSPLTWEKELKVKEVAVVNWNNRKVVLVRPDKAPKAAGTDVNPYQGFPAVLYGAAFALDNDRYAGMAGKWIVSGSEPDVEAFLQASAFLSESRWPSKDLKFVVYGPGMIFSCSGRGMFMNLNKN